jgi:hypothetical protein
MRCYTAKAGYFAAPARRMRRISPALRLIQVQKCRIDAAHRPVATEALLWLKRCVKREIVACRTLLTNFAEIADAALSTSARNAARHEPTHFGVLRIEGLMRLRLGAKLIRVVSTGLLLEKPVCYGRKKT